MRPRELWIRIIYAYEKTCHRNFVHVVVVFCMFMAIYSYTLKKSWVKNLEIGLF